MTLSPEQKQAVASWVAAGDNLSVVQKKLREQFKISLTYMDVRFLVDDLGLELKNAQPKADATDVSKAALPNRPGEARADTPARPGAAAAAPADDAAFDGDGANLPEDDLGEEPLPAADDAAAAPGAGGSLSVEVDRIVRPGAVVSGSVKFSDGVSGKWALDQYGRLMLDTGQKGYQPSATDVQAFQRELQLQLQRQGY